MIELDHVTYTYPGATQPAVQHASLTIGAGEFVLVCGPSGAGKSTLLRLLNGLVPHFHGGTLAGDACVWGRSIRTHQPRDLADVVGFVFQDPEAQFVVDVVEDELVFAMENLGLPAALMRRRVEEVLDQLGIAHLRRRRLSGLSGGEQQRVAIAAVLAAQPRALVLDEPTSQLDPHAAEEVLTALQKLNADLGLTIVLSEHRLERVVQYADRLIYLGAERQIIAGAPGEVLEQIDLAPPLVRLGKAKGWRPLPLTIKAARAYARAETSGAPVNAAKPTPANPGGAPSVQVEHVHFLYGEHEALYDVSLVARPGEVLALMGRNGSGKTTLLKLLVGLLRPKRGALRVLGHDIARMPVEQIAGMVGYVPQDPRALLFHDTLREELAFTLKNQEPRTKNQTASRTEGSQYPVLGSAPGERIDAVLAQLGLAHLAEAYPRELSGGEAQRAALAAILIAGPPVLLLDEPTRGLDYAAKERLGALLRELARAGHTILMSTHDVELVAAYADRVALLGDGELVVGGPTHELMGDSLIFSPQIAKLYPGSGWLTVEEALRG